MVIDHILPRAKDGSSAIDNLCYACSWCNSYKWSKTVGIDPQTKVETPLYNPRMQNWNEHFYWSEDGLSVIGLTPIGRATVETLRMNNEYIVTSRRYWVEAGWHPPQTITH